jgi:predicted MFS family arabinose efflux permease
LKGASATARVRSRRVVIPALGVAQILAWGSSYYLPAVLAPQIASDTGWPLTWIIGGLSLGMLVGGIASRRIGRAIHEHGGRPILAASSVLIATGLVIAGSAQYLPVYFLGWMVLGLGMGSGLYDAAFGTLGRLYGSEARTAISTLTLYGGFASTVCWPLSAFFMEHLGWRGACFAYAAIQVCVSLPTYLAAIPDAPKVLASSAPARDAPSPADDDSARNELRAFLLLAAVLTVGSAVMSVVGVHIITMLREGRGLDLAAAVALGTLIGPSQVGARVIERLFGGRYDPIWTLGASVLFVALGLALLTLNLPFPGLAIIVYGAGNGLNSIARGTMPLALFGPSHYAIWMGRVATPTLIAGALSPTLGALLLDSIGPDGTLRILTTCATLNLALVAALWRVPRG